MSEEARAGPEGEPLPPGVRLGAYEILGRLGAGGMARVYRARDPRLGRDVAIKVLAPELAQDRNALARFKREARTASSLNHPNIVHVYEVGEAPAPSGPLHYIAMELVEGETLRGLLRGGAPWRGLLQAFAQVADALARAHKAGIVHRDLKPENVMVTPDGHPKVLDFGLAKLVEPADDAGTGGTAPREGRTRTGFVAGTPAYMSPEQVQAKPVDHRSDIFSFGSMLYEAVTRRRPFGGSSSVAALHAIVYDEPVPIEASCPDAPSWLAAVVRRCLAKNPDQRYQSIADVASDLRGLALGESGPGVDAPTTLAALPTRSAARPPTLRRWLPMLLVGLAVLVTAVYALKRRVGPVASPTALGPGASLRIEKLTTRGDVRLAAVSPEGRYVAYTSDSGVQQGIWLRDIVEKTENRLAGSLPSGLRRISFSKDGRTVYWVVWNGPDAFALYRTPIIGGEPQLVRSGRLGDVSPDSTRVLAWQDQRLEVVGLDGSGEKDIGLGRSAVWLPDSSRVLVDRVAGPNHTLFVVPLDGSGERKVAELPLLHDLELEAVRGDGRVAACWFWRDRSSRRLHAVDLVDGSSRPIGDITWPQLGSFLWLPDGKGFVASEYWKGHIQIWYASYPDGNVRRIPADTAVYQSVSLTADGSRLVAVQGIGRVDILVSQNAEHGPLSKVASLTENVAGLCWTPDEKLVLSLKEAGSYDLYVMDADGSGRKALTHDRTANELQPAASPDGRTIAFVLDREDERGLWRVNRDGTGLTRLTVGKTHGAPRFTPDGHFVLFSSWNNGPSLWKIPVAGGEAILVNGPPSETPPALGDRAYGAAVSPDGGRIGFFHFTQDLQGQSPMEIAISTLDGRIVKRFPYSPLASIREAQRVRWSADGSAVYYQSLDGAQLWKQPLSGGPPVQVTHFDADEEIGTYDFSKDGRLLACTRHSYISDAVMITDFR
jgi:eukaryotic-like serine/threonine-protein kinase